MEQILSNSRQILTPKQLSEQLAIPVNTLAIWRMNGRGPRFVRCGGRLVRYRAEDVDAWLTARSTQNTASVAVGR